MAWDDSPEKRARDAATYGSAEYRRNRELARKRANGRCEKCGQPATRLECDHITPKSQGGTNALSNLAMLCAPCHRAKTYAQRAPGGKRAADPPCRPRTVWLSRSALTCANSPST